MICIPVKIPRELCALDDELKAIYHSDAAICIWTFQSRMERNRFVEETQGMNKAERTGHFQLHYHAARGMQAHSE